MLSLDISAKHTIASLLEFSSGKFFKKDLRDPATHIGFLKEYYADVEITEEEWEKVNPDLFVNGWTYWFIKKVIVLICLLLVALILLYVFQEKLLYLPGTPI